MQSLHPIVPTLSPATGCYRHRAWLAPPADDGPARERKLGSLRWSGAARCAIPVTSRSRSRRSVRRRAATLAIPYGFKRIIDRGFSSGVDPHGVAHLVPLSADDRRSCWRSPPRCRFYFVSWLGERVVADMRIAVQAEPAAPRPALLRGEPPVRDRLAPDLGHHADRAGGRHHRLGRAAQHASPADRRHRLSVRAQPQARRAADASASRWSSLPIDPARPARAQLLAHLPGPHRRYRRDRHRDAGRDEDRPGVRAGSARGRRASAMRSSTCSPPPSAASRSAR